MEVEMRTTATLVTVVLAASLGCSKSPDQTIVEQAPRVEWRQIASEAMSPAQKAQEDLALAAVNSMMAELMSELTAALENGGPAGGISVCREEAPVVAHRISDSYGVGIGRTSFALRNPSNRPPEWAEPIVEHRIDQPVFLECPDGRLGVMLPIRLRSECGMCHGPADEIAADVRDAITRYYPEDRATGFATGDLRGWFWVEVPPEPPKL